MNPVVNFYGCGGNQTFATPSIGENGTNLRYDVLYSGIAKDVSVNYPLSKSFSNYKFIMVLAQGHRFETNEYAQNQSTIFRVEDIKFPLQVANFSVIFTENGYLKGGFKTDQTFYISEYKVQTNSWDYICINAVLGIY